MLSRDLRWAIRMMKRSPVFTVAVICTVALTIAANTAIFSVVNAVLLRPLPFANPDGLIQVAEKNDKLNLPSFGASVLNFQSWREQTRAFDELAAIGFNTFTLTGNGEPEQITGNKISPALTRVLGVEPLAGRGFSNEEEKPNAAPVAMIGEGLWKRRFGADRTMVGKTVTLDGMPTTVVGIAPASLLVITGGDIYVPLTIDAAKENRLNHVITVIGRLKRGVSLQQAQSEMNTISSRLGQQYPEIHDWGITLITLFDTLVSSDLKTGLLVLLGAVVLVLLIACANVANLLLARAASRQKEIALRSAIGASGRQLLRQLLAESLVLAAAGGAAGIAGAVLLVREINHLLPANLLPVQGVQLDVRVLLFALGLTVVTGLLFGIAPAMRATRVEIGEVLKQGGRDSDGSMRGRLRNGLAAGEVALATVLLIGAGLLIQTLINLQHVRLGFDSHGLITFQLAPPAAKYPANGPASIFYRRLLDSLQSAPGVRGVAVSSGIPFGAGNYTQTPILPVGQSILPVGAALPITWRIVSPGYFKTMNIPLLRGRDFTDADGPNAPPVVIVSEATAKKFWGDGDALGRSIKRQADPKTAFTVVGVVGEVRATALNQESPSFYYPVAWRVASLMDVVVRTDGSPDALMPTIRQKVHELDAELALANVKTMDEWVANNATQPRLTAMLLGGFSALALLIAAIGIYGVLAYSVSKRTREIGVRMAMGAQRGRVLRLVVGEGMLVGAAGIVVGLTAGAAVGRILSSLVYGVPVRDPLTFVGVAVALMLVVAAACAIPAWRAAQVNPMVALRME